MSEEMINEQKEALSALISYSEKLIPGMKAVANELSGEKLEDTYEFLSKVVTGINWSLQVLNGCMDLINSGRERINRDDANKSITAFSDAYVSRDDIKIAETISNGMLPLIESIVSAAGEVI